MKNIGAKPPKNAVLTGRSAEACDFVEPGCAKRGLLRSEEGLRLLFERSSDPILLLDGKVFVDCNDAALKCMRCSDKEQLIGVHPWDISPKRQPDGRLSSRKAAEIVKATLQKGSSRFEWLHRAFDGEELWMDVSLTVIPIDEGRVMYTVWRDITERKRAEEALAASRLKLWEAMDLARIAYWEADLETGEFVFNDPFYTLYGTTAEREGGYRMSRQEYSRRFLHPEDMHFFDMMAQRRVANMEAVFQNDMEHRIIRRDGEVRYIFARTHVKRDATGRAVKYYGANQDITEHKLMTKALLESEERYRIAIESSNDGVAIVRGNRHVYVNPKFLAMFGYDDPGEILGTRPYITVHPDDHERVIALNKGRQDGKVVPSRYEFRGVRKDGTPIDVEVSTARIIYQGEPATLAYLRDTTERQHVQEQLRQSQKMEAVGTLAGGIAHDFNNMLAIILGNAEIALDDLGGRGGPSRNIEQIVKASKRARDLTKQILTFSRKTERGRNPLKLTPLLKETHRMLRDTLPTTIRMELDVRTESDTVLADAVQVQQILVNLATNAAYAMREKGGLLATSLTCVTLTGERQIPGTELPPGTYVKLAVRDTGTGMSEEVRRRVFEPFFTTKGPDEGTGMGLAVVYGIVKNHDGEITVESVPNEGTTFNVFLPLSVSEAALEGERGGRVPGGRERILLVDDERGVLEMIAQILGNLGYDVTCAPAGTDALDIFKGSPHGFDLVITDQVMPALTGTGLAEEVLKVRRDIPVILFTGYSETASSEQARAAGIKDFIMKPVTRREVAYTVRRVLDERKGDGG